MNQVVQTMAEGVIELKESYSIDPSLNHSIQYFLNRFYMMRISIRMLISQHGILFGSDRPSHPRHVVSFLIHSFIQFYYYILF